MAKRKPAPPTSPKERRMTRSLTKHAQNGTVPTVPQFTRTIHIPKKKKRRSRHQRKALRKQLALEILQKEQEKNKKKEQNAKEQADNASTKEDGIMPILSQTENEPVRQEFHDERRVSVSQSPRGKSIQITCRNYSDISDKQNDSFVESKSNKVTSTQNQFRCDYNTSSIDQNTASASYNDLSTNCNKPSTSCDESPTGCSKPSTSYTEPSTNCTEPSTSCTEPSTSCNELSMNMDEYDQSEFLINARLNLSLASFDKVQLVKKKEFLEGINVETESSNADSNSNNLESEDDDIICLGKYENDVVFVKEICNDTPSLVIIDDDSTDENPKKRKSSHLETIDLTTPSPSPAHKRKRKKLAPPSLFMRPFAHVSNAYVPNKDGLNQPFPPINHLHQPSTSNYIQPVPVILNTIPNSNSDTYISHSVYGNNFLNVGTVKTTGLRPVFIDGNNIARLHANGRYFSIKGIKICLDYFKMRGHEVTAILPHIRKKKGECSDHKLLFALERDGSVVFTPSRVVNGKTIVPYDDRFIVQLAAVHQGIVVSCDNFRDLLRENPNLRDTIENRLLIPTFVKDMIIFPSDPLGRRGPLLDEFLRFPGI